MHKENVIPALQRIGKAGNNNNHGLCFMLYRAELEAQIREKQEAKKRDKQRLLEEDVRQERDAQRYHMSKSKGGGGDPMRDDKGKIISDFNKVENMDSPPLEGASTSPCL